MQVVELALMLITADYSSGITTAATSKQSANSNYQNWSLCHCCMNLPQVSVRPPSRIIEDVKLRLVYMQCWEKLTVVYVNYKVVWNYYR